MPRLLLSAMNLVGILLVVVGVFLFANALTERSLTIGNLKFSSGADTAMFLLAFGLILFALAFVADKIFRKKS